MDEATSRLEFDNSEGNRGSKKYEVEIIRDSVVYARETKSHLLGLYYLISWKGYLKEENT